MLFYLLFYFIAWGVFIFVKCQTNGQGINMTSFQLSFDLWFTQTSDWYFNSM